MTSTQSDNQNGTLNNNDDEDTEENVMLDPSEIKEEISLDNDMDVDSDGDGDGDGDPVGMDSDSEIVQELQLHNDSCAHFDLHKDSIFCIAQHPLDLNLVATGGSEGDDAGGMGYIFDVSSTVSAVLPASYQSAPQENLERKSLEPIFKIEGHSDSISALAFTLPKGDVLLSGGLDGKLRAYTMKQPQRDWVFLGESQEVEEINWLTACPNKTHPNTIALGASDGSVWVYSIDPSSQDVPLQITQSYFLHTGSCTAGSWSSDGKLLATVSEDGSLYVWDVFGEGAAAGFTQGDGGSYVVGLSALDQRFAVDGGLFSVAVAPNGTFLAVGGAGGSIKIVSIPRLTTDNMDAAKQIVTKGKSGKKQNGKFSSNNNNNASIGQAGQILADLRAQSDGIETLAFSSSPMSLLAAGSVDGSIAIFDSAHQFAVRRLIKQAHEDHSVVKVEFIPSLTSGGCLLTSCGMDGVVRRWDTRGGSGAGLIREWKGHRGDGEGGGVLGFVQGDGSRIITAGDDGISLVFEAQIP